MFDRFTDRARKVMSYARQEAERLNHDYIGTEHILLGLCLEGSGKAIQVLKDMNIDLSEIKRNVERRVRKGKVQLKLKQIPFTPRAKKVLEFAIDEARQLDHDYLGTEHLLLGLLREGEGLAALVLESAGGEVESCRERVLDFVSGPGGILKVSRDGFVEFSKWSSQARRIFEGARKKAKSLLTEQLEVDHLLFALLRADNSNAAEILRKLGTDPAKSCRILEERLTKGEILHLRDYISVSHDFRNAIIFACQAANGWKRNYLGSEHLLLGIMQSVTSMSKPAPNLDVHVRFQDVLDLAKSFTEEE